MTAEAEKVVAVVTVVVEEEASATEITPVKPEAAIETTTAAKLEILSYLHSNYQLLVEIAGKGLHPFARGYAQELQHTYLSQTHRI